MYFNLTYDQINITIYDINSRKVFSKHNYTENSINLRFLKSGIYFVDLNLDQKNC